MVYTIHRKPKYILLKKFLCQVDIYISRLSRTWYRFAAGTAGSKSCFLKTVDVFEAVNGLKCMTGGNGSHFWECCLRDAVLFFVKKHYGYHEIQRNTCIRSVMPDGRNVAFWCELSFSPLTNKKSRLTQKWYFPTCNCVRTWSTPCTLQLSIWSTDATKVMI